MPSHGGQQSAKARNWGESLLWAAIIAPVATGAGALINPFLDRTVNWNIVTVLMPTLFVLFSFLLKKRWV